MHLKQQCQRLQHHYGYDHHGDLKLVNHITHSLNKCAFAWFLVYPDVNLYASYTAMPKAAGITTTTNTTEI